MTQWTCVQLSVQDSLNSFEFWIVAILLNIYPGMGLLDHMVILFLIRWGNYILLSIVTVSIYIPINNAHGFKFLYILTNTFSLSGIFSFLFYIGVELINNIVLVSGVKQGD